MDGWIAGNPMQMAQQLLVHSLANLFLSLLRKFELELSAWVALGWAGVRVRVRYMFGSSFFRSLGSVRVRDTLAPASSPSHSFSVQGIAVAMFLGGFWTWAIMKVLEKTIGLRVSPEVEETGLDFSEHGELAYECAPSLHHDSLLTSRSLNFSTDAFLSFFSLFPFPRSISVRSHRF